MPNVFPVTEIQKTVLGFLKEYQSEHGFPPSNREIQEKFGLRSQTSAIQYLRALESKGLIKREKGVARGIKIL